MEPFEMKQKRTNEDRKVNYLLFILLVLAISGTIISLIWILLISNTNKIDLFPNNVLGSDSGKLINEGKKFIDSATGYLKNKNEAKILEEGNNFDLKTIFGIVDKAIKKANESLQDKKMKDK